MTASAPASAVHPTRDGGEKTAPRSPNRKQELMNSVEIVAAEGTTARKLRDGYRFAAARNVGGVVTVSGQTGHRPDLSLSKSASEQVEAAFDNAAEVLAAAGLGWDSVDIVRSWHVAAPGADAIDLESFEAVRQQLALRMPNHFPVFTCLAVPTLSLPGMLIEIEFTAHTAE